MRPNQLYVGGETVWARVGSYGWSAAVVTGTGRKFVKVHFPDRLECRYGKRTPDQLRPRNPKLNGKDKPAPSSLTEGPGPFFASHLEIA